MKDCNCSIRFFGGNDWCEIENVNSESSEIDEVDSKAETKKQFVDVAEPIFHSMQQSIILVDSSSSEQIISNLPQRSIEKKKGVSFTLPDDLLKNGKALIDSKIVYKMVPRKRGVRKTDQMIDIIVSGINLRFDLFDANNLVFSYGFFFML